MNYLERDTYGIYNQSHFTTSTLDYKKGPGPHLMGANTLIGNDVRNIAGDDLGDIKEIMLDMHTGKIAYAVLSFGGFLGMGEKLFAVPWNALILDTENKCFMLNANKERLSNAPGFDKDSWPDMADQTWSKKVHDFYEAKPYWENRN